MDALHARMQSSTADLVRDFRRWHVIAVMANFCLLVATFVMLVRFPVDLT